ncbi:hypothetical protein EMPS_03619 [Entomortierella parvispora]|uniref:Uncharacterized protein n=1 Tax=Entomortierella parvispora TaxID=205924 RepID=A0A9P3H733_9FUNG|nr:hypothetical protein EMPS_03619 [Entomortierella parvispora]
MTRASKSYRSGTPKEPKETRIEKQKRLANYKVAKDQAKKFVIPGIIAVLVCVFLLFGTMYGFRGTKTGSRRQRVSDLMYKNAADMQLQKQDPNSRPMSDIFRDLDDDDLAVEKATEKITVDEI